MLLQVGAGDSLLLLRETLVKIAVASGPGDSLLLKCETLVKEVAVAGRGWRLPAVVVSDTG
jgi:hypothetical protein